MSEQHESKSAKAEFPLTPKAVHRAYYLAEQIFVEIRDGFGQINGSRLGFLCWRGRLMGYLKALHSAMTPKIIRAAWEQSPAEELTFAGCRENSALMAVYKGGWRIVDEAYKVDRPILDQGLPTNPDELNNLRLALNKECKRVLAKAGAPPPPPAGIELREAELAEKTGISKSVICKATKLPPDDPMHLACRYEGRAVFIRESVGKKWAASREARARCRSVGPLGDDHKVKALFSYMRETAKGKQSE